jgi:hypothetical protein
MPGISRRRRLSTIILSVFAAGSFFSGVFFYWSDVGEPLATCEQEQAQTVPPTRVEKAQVSLAGSPGRAVRNGEECEDYSGLAYWAIVAGLGSGVAAGILANIHRLPARPVIEPD